MAESIEWQICRHIGKNAQELEEFCANFRLDSISHVEWFEASSHLSKQLSSITESGQLVHFKDKYQCIKWKVCLCKPASESEPRHVICRHMVFPEAIVCVPVATLFAIVHWTISVDKKTIQAYVQVDGGISFPLAFPSDATPRYAADAMLFELRRRKFTTPELNTLILVVDDWERLCSVSDMNLLDLAERLEKQNEEEARAQRDAEMESRYDPVSSSCEEGEESEETQSESLP